MIAYLSIAPLMPDTLVLYNFISENNPETFGEVAAQLPQNIIRSIHPYKNKNDRRLRTAGKLLLQKAVTHFYPGEKNPLQFLKRTATNQPFFEHIKLYFSIAHSNDLCLVAASVANKTGIDVEYKKDIDAHLFQSFLHPDELAALDNAYKKQNLFYTFWTRKEAALKASGSSISDALSGINATESAIIINNKKLFTISLHISKDYETQLATNIQNTAYKLERIIF